MVVLSQLQCESLFNIPIRVQADLFAVGKKLCEQGVARVLLERQQADGALLVTGEGQWQVDLPDTIQGTTSGVWEALLAGFLAGGCRQIPLEQSLELAAAAAAYAAQEVGAGFGSPAEVGEYQAQAAVRALSGGQGGAP
jgi:fructose-1-phosphate kinase PfkB-like protein